jgi:predicted dehydrogenase
MINAGIAGLGWWGKTLVEAVYQESSKLRFVAACTGTHSDDACEFANAHGLNLHADLDTLLRDTRVDAIVLATPHSLHTKQIIKAAARGKHVFCEKPLALDKVQAELAVDAVEAAGVTLGLGYNRRLHPEMTRLRNMIRDGKLGVLLHAESTMTFPNALALNPEQWRASRNETPCGGLTPMGVHAIDAMIDLCGDIEEVYCQSFQRAVAIDADDTTSILLRMKNGISGYLATMTATAGGFGFQMYGSKGFVRLEGMTHVADASSEERRTRLFDRCLFQPIKGPLETWEAERLDLSRAILEAFVDAIEGRAEFPITHHEMTHGAAVTEAIAKSAISHRPERVRC